MLWNEGHVVEIRDTQNVARDRYQHCCRCDGSVISIRSCFRKILMVERDRDYLAMGGAAQNTSAADMVAVAF